MQPYRRLVSAIADASSLTGRRHIASHFAFKDLTESSLATDPVRRGATAMRACMLSFFNKYLKGQDDHLLDNPTNRFPVMFNYIRH